jgi:hypothetical protein
MKHRFPGVTLMLVAVAGMAIPAVAAGVRVNVPFAFEAGKATLPPGNYVVEQSNFGGGITVLNADSNNTILLITSPTGNVNAPKDPALIFEKLGDMYRLAEVRMAGSQAVAVPRTAKQALAAREQRRSVLVAIAMFR